MGKRGDGKGAWEEEEGGVFYRFPVEEESSLANKMRPGGGGGKRKASTQARRGGRGLVVRGKGSRVEWGEIGCRRAVEWNEFRRGPD